MVKVNLDEFDYDSYELEEIAEKFGQNFSQVVSKTINNTSTKKKPCTKFRKDGFYDKDKK